MSAAFDIVIHGGTIADGTGAALRKGDIAIRDGKIAAVGDLPSAQAACTLDASGKLVCPGFIDHHSHGDQNVFADPEAGNELLQGITTEVTGHCGSSMAPAMGALPTCALGVLPDITQAQRDAIIKASVDFNAWSHEIETLPMGTNMAYYAGHGSIREAVMGSSPDRPTEQQMLQMKNYVRQAMEAGFLGLTSGLIYPPGSFATVEEMSELCRVVADYGGVYCTHMRDEGDTILAALEEALTVALSSGVELVISHHKITGKHNWGLSEKTLALIESYRQKGVCVHLDQYPYNAGATHLMCAIPQEFWVNGQEALVKSLHDPDQCRQIIKKIQAGNCGVENLMYSSGGPDGVMIGYAEQLPEMQGMNLTQIARAWNTDPYDAMFRIIRETEGGAIAVFTVVGEEDLRRIIQDPNVAIGTDGLHGTYRNLFGHPRLNSTFATVFARFVRDEGLMTVEEAVRKCTSLPASISHLPHKGLLREGYDADIVVMDYDHLQAMSDYVDPMAGNKGFNWVLVNGQIAVENDKLTGILAGRSVFRNR